MKTLLRFLGTAAFVVSLASVSGCADVQEAIPGDSYSKANSSLAVDVWEATATLALLAVPSCQKHKLINTEVVSVSKPLKIAGDRATQGKWVERWTYDMCGTTVRAKVEYEVKDVGTTYDASLVV